MANQETYNFGVTDLNGKPVPDSKLTPVYRDTVLSSEDYDESCKNGVYAYGYNDERMLLSSIDLDRYVVKYIAGLWRVRKKNTKKYPITTVYDKRFVLGPEIKVNERDDFNFKYYHAALEKYDLFDVLDPKFDWYVAKCKTKRGKMMRYGQTREEARAFLRGAIMDVFGPNIASIVLAKDKQK